MLNKPLKKIQRPLQIQTLSNIRIEGNFLTLIRTSKQNIELTSFSVVKAECFPPKIKNKTEINFHQKFSQCNKVGNKRRHFNKKECNR